MTMRAGLRRSLLAAVVVLLLTGMLLDTGGRDATPTTFGTIPAAYGALFDLLAELQLPVARSYARAAELPADATVWWIDAPGVCRAAVRPEDHAGDDVEEWDGAAWVERGGTAVVFLSPAQQPRCGAIAGMAVPPATAPENAAPDEAPAPSAPRPRRHVDRDDAAAPHVVQGRIAGHPRRVESPALATFAGAGAWAVAATADGRPFVLETAHGHGRIVLVADVTPLQNAWLDRADHALVAVDLARTYGVPLIDERLHGLRAEASALRYLLRSPALPLFVGLALLGGLVAWRGRALPARVLADERQAAPALDTFVDSLATLYATSRDYTRILDAYRMLTAARLRRHFGLPPDTPLAALIERLQCSRRTGSVAAQVLTATPAARTDAELRTAAAALDRLLWEAVQ